MPTLYFTPAALSYLSQFILALLIAGHFVARWLTRRAERSPHMALLTSFFVCVVLLILLLGLEAALPVYQHLYALFPQTTILALSVLLLQQFAYRFPEPFPQRREARLALALSLIYLLFEAGYASYRFYLLASWGWVIYRPPWADYPMALGLLWAPVVLLRQAAASSAGQPVITPAVVPATQRLKSPLRFLWRPQGQAARTARALALIYLLPFGVSLLNILRSFYYLPPALFQLGLSLGVILALAAFAISYLDQLPEMTSFIVRLVGVAIVALLTVLSAVGWLITPAYAAQYHPSVPDERTLRFTPNAAGGYDVSLAPFHFERDLGANLGLRDDVTPLDWTAAANSARLDFTFPFFGQVYDTVYVNHDGVIAIGRNVRSPWIYPDYAYRYGSHSPSLFPLLLDLIPEAGAPGSGVYARQEADRLIVTWQRVPGFRRRAAVFTFQAVLYSSGAFEFSYDRLPAELDYRPDDEPLANIWVIGATPGDAVQGSAVGGQQSAPQSVDFASLAAGAAISSGPQGMVQDYYLDFRRHLHGMLWPLAYLIVVASALALIGFSSIFHRTLVQSLESLLAGVRRVNAGDLQTAMPIQHRDEIGFLTESFNRTTARLHDQVVTLETRVAARTADLAQANVRLQEEMDQRQAAQTQLLTHQAELATLAERERLARDLHDSTLQALYSVTLFAEAARRSAVSGEPSAQEYLLHLSSLVQQTLKEMRLLIYQLRPPALDEQGLIEALQTRLDAVERRAGIKVALQGDPGLHLPAPIKEAFYWVAEEALNNALKHAATTAVEIHVYRQGSRVELVVMDNGCGFNPAGLADHGGMGLPNMKARMAQVGGVLRIVSHPGEGTSVGASVEIGE